MTNLLRQSFDRQLETLREEITQAWRWPSPDAAFAWYACRVGDVALPPHCDVDLSAFSQTGFDQAPAIASAGILLSEWRHPVDDVLVAGWIAGLRRLAGRKAFTLDRQSFAYRPYEVLGVSLGASKFKAVPVDAVSFVKNVVAQLQADASTSSWARLLAIYAGAKLGIPWSSRLWCDLRDFDMYELALLHWMAVDPAVAETIRLQDFDGSVVNALLLERALTQPILYQDVGRGVIVHNSLGSALRHTLGSALTAAWQAGSGLPHIIGVIHRLCQRFPLYVRQMQRRHAQRTTMHVADEYDVQDLLHSLLVLHFEDVRPEEWTPSYAGTNTRMDFLLKSERVVIEVKMTRKGLDQKKVLEELAVDKMRYRAHPDCKALVCFVYDPHGYCHNPVALERDASEVADGFQVTVIVAPHGV